MEILNETCTFKWMMNYRFLMNLTMCNSWYVGLVSYQKGDCSSAAELLQ